MSLGWTSADQAELEVLIWHFVELADLHRICRDCTQRKWCWDLERCWLAIEVWLYRRQLLSKAQFLRVLDRREPCMKP